MVVSGPQTDQAASFRAATAFEPAQDVGPGARHENVAATGSFNVDLGRRHILGDDAYIGFRVTLDDGRQHDGCIELVCALSMFAGGGLRTMYQHLRSAREPDPNAPITVPSASAAGCS